MGYYNHGKNYSTPLKPVIKGMWVVYVLKCENNTFYVGITQNVKKRIVDHITGKGSDFTNKNKPIRVIKKIKTFTDEKGLATVFENNVVLEYANKYGVKSVGGGSFNRKGMLAKKIKKLPSKPNDVELALKYLKKIRKKDH